MQKKFNFRLEKILRLKEQKAQEIEEALNMLVLLRQAKEDEIFAQEQYQLALQNNHAYNGTAGQFQMNQHHIEFIQGEIVKLYNDKEQLLELENLRRLKLIEMKKEMKILEKLKEKKKEIHKLEQDSEETKILDEIGITRYDNNFELRMG